jgi:hypothetical protein
MVTATLGSGSQQPMLLGRSLHPTRGTQTTATAITVIADGRLTRPAIPFGGGTVAN